MDQAQEEIYLRGQRQVWRSLLQQAMRKLGYLGDKELELERLINEREDSISRLRNLCDE